jgi:hypothetical protein
LTFFVTGVTFVGLMVWGVVLFAQHTVRSVVLGVVVTVLGLQAVALRVYVMRARLRGGRNPITGRQNR